MAKLCPYCFEEIQEAAILCKYCHSSLGTPSHDISPHGVRDAGGVIERNLSKDEATAIEHRIEAVGGEIEIRPAGRVAHEEIAPADCQFRLQSEALDSPTTYRVPFADEEPRTFHASLVVWLAQLICLPFMTWQYLGTSWAVGWALLDAALLFFYWKHRTWARDLAAFVTILMVPIRGIAVYSSLNGYETLTPAIFLMLLLISDGLFLVLIQSLSRDGTWTSLSVDDSKTLAMVGTFCSALAVLGGVFGLIVVALYFNEASHFLEEASHFGRTAPSQVTGAAPARGTPEAERKMEQGIERTFVYGSCDSKCAERGNPKGCMDACYDQGKEHLERMEENRLKNFFP